MILVSMKCKAEPLSHSIVIPKPIPVLVTSFAADEICA